MERNRERAIEITAWVFVICFLLFGFTDTIDTSLPAGSDNPAEADDNMRRIQGGFQELGNVEHDYALTGTEITGDGTHTAITTTSITNAGALTNTGNITVNTDKFIVTAASGNTAIDGTLDVNGVATVAKGSLLASTDAPTTDAMIANKKYIDDQIAFSANTIQDADSATLAENVTYTATSDGFVTAHLIYNNTSNVDIIATVAGDVVQRTTLINNGNDGSLGFSVASGETFIITDSTGTPTTKVIRWRSRGTLSKPTK